MLADGVPAGQVREVSRKFLALAVSRLRAGDDFKIRWRLSRALGERADCVESIGRAVISDVEFFA